MTAEIKQEITNLEGDKKNLQGGIAQTKAKIAALDAQINELHEQRSTLLDAVEHNKGAIGYISQKVEGLNQRLQAERAKNKEKPPADLIPAPGDGVSDEGRAKANEMASELLDPGTEAEGE